MNPSQLLWRLVAVSGLSVLTIVLMQQGYLHGDNWILSYYAELNAVFGVDLLADACQDSGSKLLEWAACSFKPVLLSVGTIWIVAVIVLIFWR